MKVHTLINRTIALAAVVGGVALAVASNAASRAAHDNPCMVILELGAGGESGLFDIYKIESSSKFDSAFHEWLLLDEATRHDTQKAMAAGAKGGYGAIWGAFSKSYSLKESQEWRRALDSGRLGRVLEENRTKVYIKTLGDNAVALAKVYADCVRGQKSGGGRVSIEETDNEHLLVRIGFDPVAGGAATSRLIGIEASHTPQNGSYRDITKSKPKLGRLKDTQVVEKTFVIARKPCDSFWIIARFDGKVEAFAAAKSAAKEAYTSQYTAWRKEADKVKSANEERKRQYESAMEQWRRAVADEEQSYNDSRKRYEKLVTERRRIVANRQKHHRGDDHANAPYNFRLDIPRGTPLYFEVSPNATVRMKRDRPNGDDPDIFQGIRDGSTFNTTWDPGCENCNFYFKQDDAASARITIWLYGKPEEPTKRSIPQPAPAKLADIPSEPTRPDC